jgi:predicted GNAT family acetyltransferase
MTSSPLDNPVWACLSGAHRAYADGNDLARRYRRGYSPIAAVAEETESAYQELAALAGPDEVLATGVTDRHPLPPEWVEIEQGTILQMVADRRLAERPAAVRPVVLSESDAPAMLALAGLTQPGPFGPLTHQLGSYLGIKVDSRLVAMAGQRFRLPDHQEISAVCTHPDWRGRGFARLLVTRLAASIHDAGLTPFLHVLASNTPAISLYERLGFRARRTFVMRMLRRAAV